jgi:hypothetical protein
VLPTKTRPKKLALVGSDGRRYAYLLKVHSQGFLSHSFQPRLSSREWPS